MLEFSNKIINKLGKFIILFIFFFVAGLGYQLHHDYVIYERIYDNQALFTDTGFEIGYQIINFTFSKIMSFYQFKAVVYLINTVLIYKGIRYFYSEKKTLLIMVILYLYGHFYWLYLPFIRQSIAMSISIFSLRYIWKKELIKYLICIFIAILFHKSSILLLPSYYLLNYMKLSRENLKKIFIFFLIMVFCSSIIGNLFVKLITFLGMRIEAMNRFLWYFEIRKAGELSFKEVILFLVIFGLAIANYKKNDEFYIKGFTIYLFYYTMHRYIPIANRFSVYFFIFYIFTIINLFEKLRINKIKILLKYIILIVMALQFNLKAVWDISKRGAYIPFYNYIESFYKEIPFYETASYRDFKAGKKIKDKMWLEKNKQY